MGSTTKKKKIKGRRWSNDEIERLIDLYEENSCLWDAYDKAYHNNEKPERAISEISKTLNITAADIKCKLLALRSLLGKENAKVHKIKSGQGGDELHKPSWKYGERLQFLQRTMQPCKSKDTLFAADAYEQNTHTTGVTPDLNDQIVLKSNQTPKASRKSPEERRQQLLTTCICVLKEPIANEKANNDSISCFAPYVSEKMSKFTARETIIAKKHK